MNHYHSVVGASVGPPHPTPTPNTRSQAGLSTTWSPTQESTSSQMLSLKSVLSFDILSLPQRLFEVLPDLRLGAAFVLPETGGAPLPPS